MALAAVALGLGLAVLLWPREPRYHGKPLSYFLDQLPPTWLQPDGRGVMLAATYSTFEEARADEARLKERMDEAFEAVRLVGINALPALVKRIAHRNPRWLTLFWRLAARLHVKQPGGKASPSVRRAQALTAIDLLASRAKALVPRLVELAGDEDLEIRNAARYALESVAPDEAAKLHDLRKR